MPQYTVRDMQGIIKRNGYWIDRQNGSHQIWTNGKKTISLPTVTLRSVIAARIIKEYGLVC